MVSDNDLGDPQLKVRGLSGRGQLRDSDGTSVHGSKDTYNVTFDTKSLNSGEGDTGHTLLTDDCAFTATSRNGLAMMTIGGPFVTSPNTVAVIAAFPSSSGGLETVDTQFDILASC